MRSKLRQYFTIDDAIPAIMMSSMRSEVVIKLTPVSLEKNDESAVR